MKEYIKPEAEYVKFFSEETALVEGSGDSVTNTFSEGDFS